MSFPDALCATLAACRHGRPLLVFHNLPGPDAELRPEQARALAAALIAVADRAEVRQANGGGAALPALRFFVAMPLPAPGR